MTWFFEAKSQRIVLAGPEYALETQADLKLARTLLRSGVLGSQGCAMLS